MAKKVSLPQFGLVEVFQRPKTNEGKLSDEVADNDRQIYTAVV
jgi:hypothetical protein